VDHDIGSGPQGRPLAAEDLSQSAPCLIPDNGVADLAAHGDAQAAVTAVVREDEQSEAPARDPNSSRVDGLELPAIMKSVIPCERLSRRGLFRLRVGSAHYTVNLFRPFARRRLRTSRPWAVFIRARNPCFFLRRSLLGWNVLLAIVPSNVDLGFWGEPRMLSAPSR